MTSFRVSLLGSLPFLRRVRIDGALSVFWRLGNSGSDGELGGCGGKKGPFVIPSPMRSSSSSLFSRHGMLSRGGGVGDRRSMSRLLPCRLQLRPLSHPQFCSRSEPIPLSLNKRLWSRPSWDFCSSWICTERSYPPIYRMQYRCTSYPKATRGLCSRRKHSRYPVGRYPTDFLVRGSHANAVRSSVKYRSSTCHLYTDLSRGVVSIIDAIMSCVSVTARGVSSPSMLLSSSSAWTPESVRLGMPTLMKPG